MIAYRLKVIEQQIKGISTMKIIRKYILKHNLFIFLIL